MYAYYVEAAGPRALQWGTIRRRHWSNRSTSREEMRSVQTAQQCTCAGEQSSPKEHVASGNKTGNTNAEKRAKGIPCLWGFCFIILKLSQWRPLVAGVEAAVGFISPRCDGGGEQEWTEMDYHTAEHVSIINPLV